ncbi:MAG TPA: penicillin acylase family protein [Kofleriaceae bacterium]|jgi:penicillin amidase
MRWLHPMMAAAALVASGACGDNLKAVGDGGTGGDGGGGDADPFGGVPVSFTSSGATMGHVDAVRDKYGVIHITASNVSDAAYVQGYTMAHDRLPQMDILRRYGAGTLSELFGALDPSVIDTDLQMRMHRMKPLAEATWAQLQASSDPTDQKVVTLLQRFTDGVNQYAHDLQNGTWDVDPPVGVSFDPSMFEAWTPVDSLVLGRFQAFDLSFSAPYEIDLTELYQKLRVTYDGATVGNQAAYNRRGISRDLMTLTPVGLAPTIDGFPNVTTDSGSRSDGSGTMSRMLRTIAAGGHVAGTRPVVPQALFDAAHKMFPHNFHTGPFGALGPQAFGKPWAGSNNWAVGPSLAGAGTAILATDQHLQLPNPSIFYPTHIIITGDDPSDVLGVTFPGIPGVILGSNGHLAWAATVSEHDVNDVYMETIAPCSSGGGDCTHGGQIMEDPETFNVGAFGHITSTFTGTYEYVQGHGETGSLSPIIPTISNHAIVPRTGNTALSIAYTGYVPTLEIKALYNLDRATTVNDGFKALSDFSYGSQNWTMIDDQASIGWTTNAYVPERDPSVYTWNAQTNQNGLAPFMVLPGDGTAEWTARMSSRYVPHAINPAQGYLATANADPVGATFDNDDLNQPEVDGVPLYAGITYAAGVREERITNGITAAATAGTVTEDQMSTLQADTNSNIGEKLTPAILTALNSLDSTVGYPIDVAPYLTGLSATDRARLTSARAALQGWDFSTPKGAGQMSADTALFNTWMHYFMINALQDEFDAINFDMWELDDNQLVRIVYGMLIHPDNFVTSSITHEPVLCDSYTSLTDDSCSKVIMTSLVQAMTYLESASAFNSQDMTTWSWGKLHKLLIQPLFPNPQLNLPGPNDADPTGFAKDGDEFNINRADMGWMDLDFSQSADGPAQRFLAITTPAHPQIQVKWALPGGVIYDSRSPHYRDLLDNYYLPNQHFDAPYTTSEIVTNAESNWVFKPN